MTRFNMKLTVGILASVCVWTVHAQPLTQKSALAAVAPFYGALNVTQGHQPEAMVLKATADNWQSCAGDDVCHPRVEVAKTVAGFGQVIPDLTWEIKELIIAGNRVVVRGEGRGTPTQTFMGVPPSGQGFRLMSIDVHTIVNGKMSGKSYHIEDWAGALRQLSAH